MGDSIADMLVSGSMKSAQETGSNFLGGLKTGAGLATAISNMQTQRAEIEQKKQDIQLKKYDKVGSWFETASKMEDGPAKKAFVNEYIPKGIEAIGLGKAFDPTSLKMLQGDSAGTKFLIDQVRKGQLDASALYNAGKDPEAAAQLLAHAKDGMLQAQFENAGNLQQTINNSTGAIDTASKFATSEEGKLARSNLLAGTRGAQVQTSQERLAYDVHQKALNSVNSRPVQTLLTGFQNLDNAINNFTKGGATAAEYNELQQAVRSNMGVKGSGGVEERAKTYANSTGINASALIQFLTGDPQSVLKSSPKLAEQIISVAKLEMENKKKQASGLLDTHAKGYKTFYKKHPDLRDDFEATKSGILNQFSSTSPEAPSEVIIQGKRANLSGLQSAYKAAVNKQQFILDMTQATGKSKEEVLKLLGE